MTRRAVLLLCPGALVLLVAIAWWWATYADVISYAYISPGEAGACLVGDSDICRLARALCRGAHPVAIVAYHAATFWVAMIALSSSLIGLSHRAA